jgi:hypothetical protein
VLGKQKFAAQRNPFFMYIYVCKHGRRWRRVEIPFTALKTLTANAKFPLNFRLNCKLWANLIYFWAIEKVIWGKTEWPDEFGKKSPKVLHNYFLSQLLHNLYGGKEWPKFLGCFSNFQKTALHKQLPNRRKFNQSGHPGKKPSWALPLTDKDVICTERYVHFSDACTCRLQGPHSEIFGDWRLAGILNWQNSHTCFFRRKYICT